MYYTVLKAWTEWFGTSEVALRSLSVVCSLLTVTVVALAGKLLKMGAGGDRVALIAALFLSVNRGSVDYAQQARPYALQTLFATLTLLCAIRLLVQIHDQSNQTQTTSLRTLVPSMIGLGICAGYTLWTHNTALFMMAAVWLGMIVGVLAFIPGNRLVQAAALAIPGCLALLIWSPFVPMFITQNSNMTVMSYWITFKPEAIKDALSLVAGGGLKQSIPVGLCALLGLAWLWKWKRSVWFLVVTTLVFPLISVFTYSYFVKPIFLPRLFEWMAPLALAAAALGAIVTVSSRMIRLSLVTLIVVSCGWSTYSYYLSEKDVENWREIFNIVAQNASAEDLVVLLPNEVDVPYRYYGKRHPSMPEVMSLPQSFPALGLDRVYISNYGAPEVLAGDVERLVGITKSYRRVWLITRGPGGYDRGKLVEKALLTGRTSGRIYEKNNITIDFFTISLLSAISQADKK